MQKVFGIINNRKAKYNPYIAIPFWYTCLAGLLVGIIISIYWPHRQQTLLNKQKGQIQNLWLVETITNDTDLLDFQNMKLFYRAALTIDNELNISGVAYKIKEVSNKGEFNYKREYWSRVQINGGIINDNIIMNWNIQDYTQRNSIQTLKGTITKDDTIRGNFYNDVGNQVGTFCAKIFEINNINKIKGIPEICEE